MNEQSLEAMQSMQQTENVPGGAIRDTVATMDMRGMPTTWSIHKVTKRAYKGGVRLTEEAQTPNLIPLIVFSVLFGLFIVFIEILKGMIK